MRRLLCSLLLIVSCTALSAQQHLLDAFKPVCDTMTVLAREHFGVKAYVRLEKAMKRSGTLDLYFSNTLSDFPWRKDDAAWFKKTLRRFWPEEASDWRPGEIFCKGTPLEDLLTPHPGNDGRPANISYKAPSSGKTEPFITQEGAKKFPKGLSGRHIALWQSHGRYYDEGAGEWSWQRSPNWRTTEDLYTQGYVLPFLIPMLERAGAYVMTPRERDTDVREIICDNDRHFDSPGAPVRVFGSYNETGAWSNAGSGFADKCEFYTGEDNPFTMGTVRKANSNPGKITATARWKPGLSAPATLSVYISYASLENSSTRARYTVHHRGGKSTFIVNQRLGGGTWIYLGTFDLDKDSYVTLDNGAPKAQRGNVVTADAVKFGGGMGKIARGPEGADSLQCISGMPSYLEGARYWMQWAGVPADVYRQWETDYTCDYASRGAWVKMVKGDKGIPVDLSLAFHTDAGVTPNDSIVGTLAIYTLKADGSRKFKNGGDRMACRVLCDFIQTQIVEDLRADYDSLWSRRQVWDRSYSESRTTDVPGMLLELLSHQNFADMKFGLDPRYRFDVCRAIYKGMLKFIAAYNGNSYTVAPLPVSSFAARLEGAKAVLSWEAVSDPLEPTAEPGGYIVYTRKDDGAFDSGREVKGCSYEADLEAGHIYSFRVEAFNAGGRSFPSEVLCVANAGGDAKKVLIVNNFDRIAAPSWFDSPQYGGFDGDMDSGVPYVKDITYAGESYEYRRDRRWAGNSSPGFGACETSSAGLQIAGNTFDFASVHAKHLLALGYSVSSSSRGAFEKDGSAGYEAIDIICGKQISTLTGTAEKGVRYRVFPEAFRQAIAGAAENGCNILISGAYIATDAWDSVYPIEDDGYAGEARDFIRKTLGYKWITSRGSKDGQVILSDGTSIEFSHSLNPDIYCVETAGAIRPDSAKGQIHARYGNRLGAAVFSSFPDYKVAAWSFPLETILDDASMARAFKDSFEFFNNK